MFNLGILHHFLGIGILQTDQGVFIHQSKYAKSLLVKFGFEDCKPVSIPLPTDEKLKKVDGSELDEKLYRKIMGNLLYLAATRPDLMYFVSGEDDSRSTSRYAFSFGSGVFSWASVKQDTVALSTAKAKYASASEAIVQSIWLRFVLDDFGEMQTEAIPLFCDNMSAISMVRNPVFH
ncbi:unnamed protein product [Malus baccata var. baccata]